jgi:predicted nucleic acid-binding protein
VAWEIVVMSNKRALLDTNIIIHREASTVVNDNIGTLFNWLDRLGFVKCVHPLTLDELRKHKDLKTSKSMAVKVSSYEILRTEAPLVPDIAEIMRTYDKDQNDRNDSRLLNELLSKRVDIVITEDTHIHEKARFLKISSLVYSIESFIQEVTAEYPDFVNYKVLSIQKDFFGHVNLGDDFFDSFKEDYSGYEDWFRRKSDHVAYLCKQQDKIRAFLYLKIENEEENYSDITPIFPKAKRLKIGAFKVSQYGNYLGERLLKIIFDNALASRVKEIYVTIFPKRPEQMNLIYFLEEWGFERYGTKRSRSGDELVFVRKFNRVASQAEPLTTFPYFSKSANYFLVPIRPEYHTELLPDSILRTESPADFVENEPHRTALRKVYISHSVERDLRSGDVIAFYRTGGLHLSVVTTLGIVENIITAFRDLGEMIKLSRKRAVLTDQEIARYWDRYPGRRPFLVNFLYAYSLPKRPNLAKLIELGVVPNVESAPRGFTSISWDKFYKIVKVSEADENLIVN